MQLLLLFRSRTRHLLVREACHVGHVSVTQHVHGLFPCAPPEGRHQPRGGLAKDMKQRHWRWSRARHWHAAREAPAARLEPVATHGSERHQAIRGKDRALAIPAGTIRGSPHWPGCAHTTQVVWIAWAHFPICITQRLAAGLLAVQHCNECLAVGLDRELLLREEVRQHVVLQSPHSLLPRGREHAARTSIHDARSPTGRGEVAHVASAFH
eukprot:scaffold53740_cov68-Phaeocystis_antarctica.AAC.9